jgi:hypothetical protein
VGIVQPSKGALALAALAAASLAGTLAACDTTQNVATMGGSQAPLDAEAQAASADDFAECLTAAGIPAESFAIYGVKLVQLTTEAAFVMALGDGGAQRSWAKDMTEAEAATAFERMENVAASHTDKGDPDRPRYLVIGTADHTDALVECLDRSGYTEPEVVQDPADELAQKQRDAADGAEWAACARENGYPAVKDPDPPKADAWETQPMVLLPPDMTEDALRELLAACPNFDEAGQRAFDAAGEAATGEEPPDFRDHLIPFQPPIGFDSPGYRGGMLDGAPVGPEEQQRLDRLQEILWEASNAYFEGSRPG